MKWVRCAGALLVLGTAGGCEDKVIRPCDEYTPDWEGVQCMMETHCVSCHGASHPSPPAFITTLPDAVENDLIECNGDYVVPGDLDASQLWRVLSGNLVEGTDVWGTMPWQAGYLLPPEEVDHVREWIEAGAPDFPGCTGDGGGS